MPSMLTSDGSALPCRALPQMELGATECVRAVSGFVISDRLSVGEKVGNLLVVSVQHDFARFFDGAIAHDTRWGDACAYRSRVLCYFHTAYKDLWRRGISVIPQFARSLEMIALRPELLEPQGRRVVICCEDAREEPRCVNFFLTGQGLRITHCPVEAKTDLKENEIILTG